MSVNFVKPAPASVKAVDTPAYRVKAKPVSLEYLRGPGSLRVQHLMYLYNCSQSAIYRKIKADHIPPPSGVDPRLYWSNEVIRQHLGIAESR